MNYNKIYQAIIDYRIKNKLSGYTERHHIIPRSLGGSDDKNNLVDLSAREHYICHLLLTKMYKKNTNEYYKTVHAYMMMCNVNTINQKRIYRVNSRLYEKYKKEYSIIMSVNQSGELNSQFGTKWIYNPIIKESKKVPKELLLDNDWYLGRVTDWNKHFTQKYCIICNKKGLKSKLSKTCSDECSSIHKSEVHKSFDNYENEIIFKRIYIETKSIRKTLKSMGKVCGGDYHTLAVKWICCDEEMSLIYKPNIIDN